MAPAEATARPAELASARVISTCGSQRAFAVVAVANNKLAFSGESQRLRRRGDFKGSIRANSARILVTLLYAMKRGAKRGLASLCIGGAGCCVDCRSDLKKDVKSEK
jgi:acetyl-CoA acetyltransferase